MTTYACTPAVVDISLQVQKRGPLPHTWQQVAVGSTTEIPEVNGGVLCAYTDMATSIGRC